MVAVDQRDKGCQGPLERPIGDQSIRQHGDGLGYPKEGFFCPPCQLGVGIRSGPVPDQDVDVESHDEGVQERGYWQDGNAEDSGDDGEHQNEGALEIKGRPEGSVYVAIGHEDLYDSVYLIPSGAHEAPEQVEHIRHKFSANACWLRLHPLCKGGRGQKCG